MPLPGREESSPNLRAIAWSILWSSGFLKSSWMTLWSTYCTARSTCTRSTSSCSNCMHAIVPVASCRSVWSTLSAIGSPGFRSPSTRCSSRILRVRLAAIGRESYSVTPAGGASPEKRANQGRRADDLLGKSRPEDAEWRRFAGASASADVLAGDDPRHHLIDPVDAHRVVLARHVAGGGRGVHPDQPALLVHERAAGVPRVDHGVRQDHVLVRPERVAALVHRAEGRRDGRDVAARRRQLGTREAWSERALRDVMRARIPDRHNVIADLEVLLRAARQVLEARPVADLDHADVLAVRGAEDLRGLTVRARPERVSDLLDLQVVALGHGDVAALRHHVRVGDDDALARVPDPARAAADSPTPVVVHDEPGGRPDLVDDLGVAE